MKKVLLKVILALIGIVAVLACIVGFVFGKDVVNIFKRQFNSPVSYLRYTVSKNVDASMDEFAKVYDKSMRQGEKFYANGGGEAHLGINITDEGHNLISGFSAQDTSWIKSLGFDYSIDNKGGVNSLGYKVLLNDYAILSGDVNNNSDEKKVKIKVNELNDKVIVINGKEYEDFAEKIFDAQKFYSSMPDGKSIKNIAKKYTDVIFKNIENADLKKEKRNIGDISENVYVVRTVIESKDAKKMLSDIHELAKNDEELKAVLNGLYKAGNVPSIGDKGDFYELFIEELSKIKEGISEDAAGKLTLEFIIDKSGNVVGIALLGDDNTEVSALILKKGRTYALDYKLYNGINSDSVEFKGSGEIVSYKASGNFEAFVGGKKSFDMELKRFDLKKLRNGNLDFESLVKIPASAVSESLYLLNEGIDINFVLSSDRTDAELNASVLYANKEILNIKSESKIRDFKEIKDISGEEIVIKENSDMQAYIKDIKWEDFINKLKVAGVPENYLSLLGFLF